MAADDKITIKVNNVLYGGKTYFELRKTKDFRKLMDAYCGHTDAQPEAVRFVFDGNILDPYATPQDLEMEDEDEIHAVIRHRPYVNWNGNISNVSQISIYPLIKQMDGTTLRLKVVNNNYIIDDEKEIHIKISKDDLPAFNKLVPTIEFDVKPIHYYLLKKDINDSFKLSLNVSVFITVVLEYLFAEITHSLDHHKKVIEPLDLQLAILHNDELLPLFLDRVNEFDSSPANQANKSIVELSQCIYNNLINNNDSMKQTVNRDVFLTKITSTAGAIDDEHINGWIEHLNQLFDFIDTDHDDCINEEDLIAFFTKNTNRLDLKKALMHYSVNFNIDSKLNENSMNMKLKEIVQNIDNYLRNKNHHRFKALQCKINDMESVNDNDDKNICNILGETGIYLFIFDYLEFDELRNNVYKTCKLFHNLSLRILNQKYFDIVCNGYFINMIRKMWVERRPDMELREDTAMIMSGLLLCVLNDFVDKIKEKMDSHQYDQELLRDIVCDLFIDDMERKMLNRVELFDTVLVHGVVKMIQRDKDNDKGQDMEVADVKKDEMEEDETKNMDKLRESTLCEDEEEELNEPPLKRRRIDETGND